MSYSQNSEEDVILDYFGNFKGHLLDIGANDGITLSNSREMIVRGWGGVLVEPSPTAFKKLKYLYLDHSKIDLLNVAIGATNGPAMFYESGSLLDRDDVALV
jgi:FkbM family methyltransferase